MQPTIGFAILLTLIGHGLCMIEEINMPPFLKNCLVMKTKQHDVTEAPSEHVCNTCLTRYMWLEGPNLKKCGHSGDNTTMYQITDFFGKILCGEDTGRGRRKKRQAKQKPMRQEYRKLTKQQRQRFHAAANKAYSSGYFGWLARFHDEQVKGSAHGGPAFFGYHRFLLLIFDKILQHFDPTVALPYWNSALDANLDFPEQSIVWTDDYFGPSHGIVNSGPFSHWKDYRGNRITRAINQGGSLFTSSEISDILSKPNIYALSEPSPQTTLESYHDDVHNYIGGTMMPVELAPWDMIFWLHHCFVDYLWEVWRYNHGYDTQYPVYQGLINQQPFQNIKHMPYINFIKRIPTNEDGYSKQLAQQTFYQLSPTCSEQNPDCGSEDLQCRLDLNPPQCVSVDSKFRRQTQALNDAKRFKNVRFNGKQRVGRKKRDTSYQSGFSFRSADIDKVYIPMEKESCMGKPVQNTFIADCTSDVKKWAFIPIKVVHLRPNEVRFDSTSNVFSGDTYDMYDEHKYENLKQYIKPGNPATYPDCHEDESGAFKVRIKSYGISYFGIYTDYVFVDNRLPVSSHVGYIAIEKPTAYKSTMTFITASDACGRLCKPTCLKRQGNRVYYVPCSGAIKITDKNPAMYGRDFGEAVLSIWQFHGNYTPLEREDNIFMVFYCDYSNQWPWPECNKSANKG